MTTGTRGRALVRFHRADGDPVDLEIQVSALWPEGADEPEFGILCGLTPDGERYTAVGEPARVTRITKAIDRLERAKPGQRRGPAAALAVALRGASLRIQPGWPDDWVNEAKGEVPGVVDE